MSRRQYRGNTQPTTLASPVGLSDTTATLVDGSSFPDGSVGPFALTVDSGAAGEEKWLVTGRTGNNLTGITRGYDSTSAASHSAGASVKHTISAVDLDEANAHLNTTTADDHTQYAKRGQGLAANVGAASRAGRLYIATDSEDLYADDGSTVHRYLSKPSSDAAYVMRSQVAGSTTAATESTTSSTYTDLTTVGPSVTTTIGPSGKALVTVSAYITGPVTNGLSYMGVATSGASTFAANDQNALAYQAYGAGAVSQSSFTFLANALTPGSNTFTGKYRSTAGNSTFGNRQITVIPL